MLGKSRSAILTAALLCGSSKPVRKASIEYAVNTKRGEVQQVSMRITFEMTLFDTC